MSQKGCQFPLSRRGRGGRWERGPGGEVFLGGRKGSVSSAVPAFVGAVHRMPSGTLCGRPGWGTTRPASDTLFRGRVRP